MAKYIFKPSINVRLDIYNEEVLKSYFPTPSHADALNEVLHSLLEETNVHSHLVIGPYGTGKSLLATIILSIVTKSIKEKERDFIINKYQKVDESIYSELKKVSKTKKKYIPVILNGYEGNFQYVVLGRILQALKDKKIMIQLPGESTTIIQTVKMWEESFEQTFEDFLQLLKDRKIEYTNWKKEIQHMNQDEMEWFKNVFPSLTAGSRFAIHTNVNFTEQLSFIIDALSKKNIGIFLVYDEFGRYLQNINYESIYNEMQEIQNIAEIANSSNGYLQLLFITHQNIRNYFSIYDENVQNEFQRIEKRFSAIAIESDPHTFYRIAQEVIQNLEITPPGMLETDKMIQGIRKYPFFPSLTQTEIENIIITGAYPLHPVALSILPQLSSLLAQNERTLFTFLQSEELFSLSYFIKHNQDAYYYPDYLFDYFYEEQDAYQDSFTAIKLYKQSMKEIATEKNSSHARIIKLLTMWDLLNLHAMYPMQNELLSFCLGLDENELEHVLNELKIKKIIRFNRVVNHWEIFIGSSINIDEAIEGKKIKTILNPQKKLSIIQYYLPKQYYLSDRYNDEKSMIRFAKVIPLFSSIFLDVSFDIAEYISNKFSDATIVLILLEDYSHLDKVKNKVLSIEAKQIVFCLNTRVLTNMNDVLLNLNAINLLLEDVEFLDADKNVKYELELRKKDEEFTLEKKLEVFDRFSPQLSWIVEGKEREIESSFQLEKELSNLMYRIFPDTPVILNDNFNRQNITNVQLRSAYKVIDGILTNPHKEQLGISGNGPDYLIYVSTIKNNKIDFKQLDQIPNESMKKLRDILMNNMSENEEQTLEFLINVFRDSPFGIREPVIPVLFTALVRDKWDQLLFYRNDMYVPNLDGEKIYEMVKESDAYTYKYYDISSQYKNTMKDIFYIFSDDKDIIVDLHILSKQLLRWLRELPRFTQITNQVSDVAVDFKTIIRQSEVDPKKFIEGLHRIIEKYSLEAIKGVKNELESFDQLHKEKLKNRIRKVTGKDDYDEMLRWAKSIDNIAQHENKIASTILTSKGDWIEDLIVALLGVPRDEWSDTTDSLFDVQLESEWEKQQPEEQQADIQIVLKNGEVKNINEVEFSVKGNTLYKNLRRMLLNSGRNVPNDEKQYLVIKLLEELNN